MITTIQISSEVKTALDRMKLAKETYEQIIVNLIKIAEKNKREQEELLIEGCRVMAEENLRICKEWENTDLDLDWECERLVPKKYLKQGK